jgi:signal transduction histidine kinase
MRLQLQLARRRLESKGAVDPDALRRALSLIVAQTDRLTGMVNDLLDVSRIEAGKLTLERRPTDLRHLVAGCIELAASKSDRHAITLEGPARIEAVVDGPRLEQVVANLLDNAIKYSPEGGGIDVAVGASVEGLVTLTVRDHGIGIPPERRDRIFERFGQAHGEGHYGGMGLGLYISRQIVQLHGGEITVEFPEDGGSRFVVHLPPERA